jgi:uncharacterized protein YqhQ
VTTVQIGGMALRDGVLLQSERFWAAALVTPAGEIEIVSGKKHLLPGHSVALGLPVVRGLARLVESAGMLPALRRRAGRAVLPMEDPRLLAATVGSTAATVLLRRSRKGSPLAREATIAAASLAPALLALRSSELSRYHGAEHKSVAAYETGGSADEAAREHERCGSNLVAPLVLTNLATGLMLRGSGRERRPLAVLLAGLVSIGSAVELFSWMAKHKGHPVADMLRAPGIELQHLFTTREPTERQLDVAHAAMEELLRLEGVAPAATAPAGA